MKARYKLVGYKEDRGRYYTWRIWDSIANKYAGDIDGYAPYYYAKKVCFGMNEKERNNKQNIEGQRESISPLGGLT